MSVLRTFPTSEFQGGWGQAEARRTQNCLRLPLVGALGRSNLSSVLRDLLRDGGSATAIMAGKQSGEQQPTEHLQSLAAGPTTVYSSGYGMATKWSESRLRYSFVVFLLSPSTTSPSLLFVSPSTFVRLFQGVPCFPPCLTHGRPSFEPSAKRAVLK
ncbi:hypothetical protein PHLGIDRAFT_276682 [Phlebiopsis gigantea 11061_1 CR5-6]|uniref:Uncharacterized protein n=1 Tax=Phlebiopsis gigantea (strain 11061_1 CR5-6) TaxID=745531 RepID=A0A0C3RRQ0_PHLG1|nr:hypothetical protein PHLGIDRAFT_276682 [Phlebiopsis gigantea 11061_1 CR5-6]